MVWPWTGRTRTLHGLRQRRSRPGFEDGPPSDLARGRKSARKHENNPSPARVASPWATATLAQHRVAVGRAAAVGRLRRPPLHPAAEHDYVGPPNRTVIVAARASGRSRLVRAPGTRGLPSASRETWRSEDRCCSRHPARLNRRAKIDPPPHRTVAAAIASEED